MNARIHAIVPKKFDVSFPVKIELNSPKERTSPTVTSLKIIQAWIFPELFVRMPCSKSEGNISKNPPTAAKMPPKTEFPDPMNMNNREIPEMSMSEKDAA